MLIPIVLSFSPEIGPTFVHWNCTLSFQIRLMTDDTEIENKEGHMATSEMQAKIYLSDMKRSLFQANIKKRLVSYPSLPTATLHQIKKSMPQITTRSIL